MSNDTVFITDLHGLRFCEHVHLVVSHVDFIRPQLMVDNGTHNSNEHIAQMHVTWNVSFLEIAIIRLQIQ